jgi:hypothetical protein
MVHPGENDAVLSADCEWSHKFQEEFKAVSSTQVANLIKETNITLASFSDIH